MSPDHRDPQAHQYDGLALNTPPRVKRDPELPSDRLFVMTIETATSKAASTDYNQILGALGNSEFNVEYTGVAVRHRAGTLEVLVDYDQEAFDKGWVYLAESQ